jgi:N6-adenosine-specific RNA methylase IME4
MSLTLWPFGKLDMFAYDVIMIDPSTRFETWSDKNQRRSPQSHYRTMPMEEIRALPVGDLARSEGCVLFMWTTWPLIDEAPAIMRGWGFHFSSGGVWVKRTVHGKLGFGAGYRLRSACEPWLLGTIGSPMTSKSHRNVIEGQLREYSRKPDEAYSWLESYMPNAVRRADVYSRESRAGWEAFGDEAGRFDGAAA